MNVKLQQRIDNFIIQENLSGASLIITLFGDCIFPHGGVISLASLIEFMSAFGFNERLVRTAVYRLVKNGWLTSEKIGRNSYYRVTETMQQRFLQADDKIYHYTQQAWDYQWHLVLISSVELENKALLKKELEWLGFVSLTTNMMAYPSNARTELALQNLLVKLEMTSQVVVFKAHAMQIWQESYPTLKAMVEANWPIRQLHIQYEKFIEEFRGILNLIESDDNLDPIQAFQIRILLIHQYRRAILKDPNLPFELLPTDWLSLNAHNLTRNLYHQVVAIAESHFLDIARTSEGQCSPLTRHFIGVLGDW